MTREVFGPGVCVCMCDESPMCPVGYRLYRGRVIENAFVGVGHMAMMAFNTDIIYLI